MGIVASNKKVLEINETYRHWQQPVGGRNEAHDATASGGGGQGGEPLSAQPQKEKNVILSELVELTEYSRAYARRVLRQHGQRIKSGKQSLVVDVRMRASRHRSPFYDEQVKAILIKIWKVMDYICGKRLQPALQSCSAPWSDTTSCVAIA